MEISGIFAKENYEDEVIGSLIVFGSNCVDPVYYETLLEVMERLNDTDFIGDFNRRIFQIISAYHRKHRSFPTCIAVLETERNEAELQGYDLETELRQRVEAAPYRYDNLLFAVEQVKTDSIRRTIDLENERYFHELRETAGDLKQIDRVLCEHKTRLDQIEEEGTPRSAVSCASHIWLDYLKEVEQGRSAAVYPTGFSRLDAVLNGGYEAGTVNIISGRPGDGKTAFSTQIAFNIAKAGYSVLYYSLEMDKTAMIRRIYQQQMQEWINPASPSIPKDKASDFNKILSSIHFDIYDRTNTSITDIEAQTAYYNRKFHVDAVVIDYVGKIEARKGMEAHTEYAVLTDISKKLADLAKRQKIALIALAQINREGGKIPKQNKPNMGNLKGSGALEQDAHTVLILSREEEREDRREAIIAKNRNGRAGGSIEFGFDGVHTRFIEESQPGSVKVRDVTGNAKERNGSKYVFLNSGPRVF